MCPEVPKREIKMGEIEENWQPAKFYCSEIKLIYSTYGGLKYIEILMKSKTWIPFFNKLMHFCSQITLNLTSKFILTLKVEKACFSIRCWSF